MTRLYFPFCFLCVSGLAQFSFDPRATVLRGRVSADRSALQLYSVLIESLSDRMTRQTTVTDIGGEFNINGVPCGEYRLTVSDRSGATVHQGFISVIDNGPPVEIQVAREQVSRPTAGVVTIAALRHKVPRKAARRLESALAARRRGDLKQSVHELLGALSIDPGFTEAHNNLAAAYIDLGRYDDANRELDVAATIDPASPLVALNRAVCLTRMGEMSEAEVFARRAIELDRTSPRARFALGAILFEQRKFTAEAVDNLKMGAQSVPTGHLMAAQILATNQRTAEASEQLRRYLDSGEAPNRPVVEKWLVRLTAPSVVP